MRTEAIIDPIAAIAAITDIAALISEICESVKGVSFAFVYFLVVTAKRAVTTF